MDFNFLDRIQTQTYTHTAAFTFAQIPVAFAATVTVTHCHLSKLIHLHEALETRRKSINEDMVVYFTNRQLYYALQIIFIHILSMKEYEGYCPKC